MAVVSRTAYGHRPSTTIGGVTTPASDELPDIADVKRIPNSERYHGLIIPMAQHGVVLRYHSTSVVVPDDIMVIQPDDGIGRWLRIAHGCTVRLPFSAATANDAVIWTVPVGCFFALRWALWDVYTIWSGGTNPTVAIGSSKYAGTGTVLGGASGDGIAIFGNLGHQVGTVGSKISSVAELSDALFKPGDSITFQRVTSAFTAGTADVHIIGFIIKNDGQ